MLVLYLIYLDQGISLWFVIHLIAGLMVLGGSGRYHTRRRRRDDVKSAGQTPRMCAQAPGAGILNRYRYRIGEIWQMERRKVGILGATGMVGQRFIQLLSNHPWFEIAWLAASDRSAGKTYGEACKWKLDTPLPARIAAMTVQPNVPEGSTVELPKIIFAALDADIARELEPKFAAAGCAVISNSSAFRMTADVPLVVPEVNADHLGLIEAQSWRKESPAATSSRIRTAARLGWCCR